MTLAAEHSESSQRPPQQARAIGLCIDCNYPLFGLPTPRCPECGREFDPMNPATMNMGRELGEVAKWVLGPVRWPVALATWAALGFALWAARLPGQQIRNSNSLWILIGLGLLWLAWPIVRVMTARRYSWPQSLLMRGQKQRILVGLTLLLGAVGVWYQLPLKAALAISRPALDRLAHDQISSTNPYLDDRWVGLYVARRVQQLPGGGMRFTVEEKDRAYKAGFTYQPNVDRRRMRNRSNRSFQYLGDGWWAWREEG